jgi:hypothetical protein
VVAVVTVENVGSKTAFPVPVVVRPGRIGLVASSSGVVPATSVDAFEDDGWKNDEKSHDGSDSDCRNSKLDVLVDVSLVVVFVVASVVAFVTIWRLTCRGK